MNIINNNKKTIAFLMDNNWANFTEIFWTSLHEITSRLDINLILFPCESKNEGKPYDYHFNLCFDYLVPGTIDGIICLSNIVKYTLEYPIYAKAIEKWIEIPTVSIGVEIPGAITTLTVDNQKGMREAMIHLIEVHHFRRIGFINGIATHNESQQRLKAYLDILDQYGIPRDEDLFYQGDFFIESGLEAATAFFDQRQVSIEAVVCSNDEMAIGFIQGCFQRNILVPQEMHVVGYDNIKDVQFHNSPLSTIDQPFYEASITAVNALIDHWEGRPVAPHYVFESKFIPRTSCGCQPTFEHEAIGHPVESAMYSQQLDAFKTQYIESMHMCKTLIPHIKISLIDTVERIATETLATNAIKVKLDQLAKQLIDHWPIQQEQMQFFKSISYAQKYIHACIQDTFTRYEADKAMEAFLSQLNNFVVTTEGLAAIVTKRQLNHLIIDGIDNMVSPKTEDEILSQLPKLFQRLNIQTGLVSYFEKQERDFIKQKIALPKMSEMTSKTVFFYSNNKVLTCSDKAYESKYFMEPELKLEPRRYTMIYEPLFFKEDLIGSIILELGMKDCIVYESIRRHLSSAIEIQLMFKYLKNTQNQLVESEKMAALGTLVAGVAHEISTPVGVGVSAASFLNDQTKEIEQKITSNQLTKKDFTEFLQVAKDTSEILLGNLQKAATLITGFKNISADQIYEEKRYFDIVEYTQQIIVSLMPETKRYKITFDLQGDSQLMVLGYPGAYGQVLTNLIVNSLKHGFTKEMPGIIRIEIFEKNQRVKINYSDNGKGILPEHMDKIFNPFFTTLRGEGGTGLGLNIVYSIVTQKLLGEISCESDHGQGVLFKIRIPTTIHSI